MDGLLLGLAIVAAALILAWRRQPGPAVPVEVRQGRGGRWRWSATLASGRPIVPAGNAGWRTPRAAAQDAQAAFPHRRIRVRIVQPDRAS